ncbi:MAG TPA: hypothetical protein VGB87_22980 [Vicinamibacteria bacterium]
MPRRVDARDVLDADATTSRAFPGRVVGFYRRTGSNSWDDYVLVDEDGGPIEVLAETPIQVEAEGATFRMRRRGEVIRVAWTPGDGGGLAGDGLRARFLKACVRDEDPTPEGNLGAWLHGKLGEKPEPHD